MDGDAPQNWQWWDPLPSPGLKKLGWDDVTEPMIQELWPSWNVATAQTLAGRGGSRGLDHSIAFSSHPLGKPNWKPETGEAG